MLKSGKHALASATERDLSVVNELRMRNGLKRTKRSVARRAMESRSALRCLELAETAASPATSPSARATGRSQGLCEFLLQPIGCGLRTADRRKKKSRSGTYQSQQTISPPMRRKLPRNHRKRGFRQRFRANSRDSGRQILRFSGFAFGTTRSSAGKNSVTPEIARGCAFRRTRRRERPGNVAIEKYFLGAR